MATLGASRLSTAESLEAVTESMETTPADSMHSRKPVALPTLDELTYDDPDFLAAVTAKYRELNPAVSPEGVDGC